jgi:cellulose synthase/poly-beta-1,6-N-acetylglucosamine synthase-like glycosyltransferase
LISTVLVSIAGGAIAFVAYTYIGYPLTLRVLAVSRRRLEPELRSNRWPSISITVPAHNEAAQIRETLHSLLRLDYPAEKRQILVVSDASDDGTDEIVAGFADQDVELLRIPKRVGKTAAENFANSDLRGEIIVNTDASIRIQPHALKPLIAAFEDPTIGVASGRDISVGRNGDHSNVGEAGYVGHEMWLRDLETRVGGIVGASGCLYAIRANLHEKHVPEALSRDFSAAMVAREHGYRAVSVPDATCLVPRAGSLRTEYRRKVRTMTRGIQTLLYRKHLLNPFRYGRFAWMLFSHKLARWLVPWALAIAVAALGVLAVSESWARWAVGGVLLGSVIAAVGWFWPGKSGVPRLLTIPSFLVAGNLAALQAWIRVFRGRPQPVWEPTPREEAVARPAARFEAEPRG